MTQHTDIEESDQLHQGPESTPRLRLKRKAPISGFVDGAWWPHSDDLSAELPDLLTVLSVRLGNIERVRYNRAEWVNAPAKLRFADQLVRLDGYDRHPAGTLGVQGSRGGEMLLLVIPAHTDPDQAHAAMMATAASENASSIRALLATRGAD
ncbi:MAG: hypothetical protein HZB45_22770 [Mycolicibacterium rufum]|uniref:Uncharacterized protein n=1 Tax=Mycolicibacterium chlorophenolicum TaxID=37916 RepID=A0A0J6WLK9_9MYCO|nr:DUF5994 family protein [Mycolicibacterium chlorophenolicum]KMO82928.1 hypothetical protein MCHLDSM_00810 [Mycolicibacterium chlorophenolicum]MBI5340515.1 hypothetical protein [Mycolicibacterium rufum]